MLDAACRPESATYALLHLDDDHVVRSSIASLLALVVAEAIRTSVRYPVHHGITRIVGVVEPSRNSTSARATLAPAGTPVAGIQCLLPTTAGRAERARIAAQPATAVPVVLYPLVAAVVAEASGDLVPLIETPHLFGGTTAAAIAPATMAQVAAWRLRRSITSPASAINRSVRRASATSLAAARRLADTRPAMHALRALGVDTDRSSGVVTRLRAVTEASPWTTTTLERAVLRAPACNPIEARPGTP